MIQILRLIDIIQSCFVIAFIYLYATYLREDKTNKKPRVFYWRYTFSYNGFIIPMVGIVINKSLKQHPSLQNLIDHEYVHWLQYKKRFVIPFLILYIYQIIKHGYDLAPLEIEARYNETPFVKLNYTFAVRLGVAQTPANENFRRGKKTSGNEYDCYMNGWNQEIPSNK